MMFCFTLALKEEQENKLEELYNRVPSGPDPFCPFHSKVYRGSRGYRSGGVYPYIPQHRQNRELDGSGSKKFHADYSAPLMLYPFGA